MSRDDRLAMADFVIDNSGRPDALEAEVERAWKWIDTLPASREQFRQG
jgi:dephospho-CoA kinase